MKPIDAEYKVHELQQKVADLIAQLRAKDGEMAELRELADAAAGLQAQDVQAAKIIELSKKNRMLTLALEKEKQRASSLQTELRGAAGAAAAPALPPDAVEDIARSMVEEAAEAAEAAQKEAAMWKERHQAQTNKMAQLEQRAFTLEIESKRLARALQREVGEEVPLAKVLEEGGDWKGRREQIIALRDQVRALRAAQGLAGDSRQEAAAKKALGKISGARAAELDRLTAELAAARAEVEALRQKHDAAVQRRKVLEAEMGGMRDKVAVVLDKTANDDRLIAALRAELAAANRRAAVSAGAARTPDEDELWQEVGVLRRRAAEQDSQIERQEQIILALQARAAAPPPSTPPRSRDGVLEQAL
eukprot:CAMPEP_0202872114 /NCGR_PEP_ID=MMETSP1391-20130828/20448_1 /ASSEMBLY_ACC=CAM_ASM_000867 /TAXON_ID=1034604 /ORGANISM="Chlamydomonas leiostraca, Strain SAG 11-49" /LENGTH=361 /DNA_ID=CAMNT_0049553077 /DNA_START=33 /DNA_END=1114 /DNA_ORIENTATION=-